MSCDHFRDFGVFRGLRNFCVFRVFRGSKKIDVSGYLVTKFVEISAQRGYIAR